MILAVLDANVLISAFPAQGGVPGRLIEAWLRGQFELVTSAHILGEVEATWATKPYFQVRYGTSEVDRAITLLREGATLVTPVTTVRGVAPSAEDDLVLGTAVAGRVDYLVTGDIPFREKVERYQGVVLLSPREFLDLLERGNGKADALPAT